MYQSHNRHNNRPWSISLQRFQSFNLTLCVYLWTRLQISVKLVCQLHIIQKYRDHVYFSPLSVDSRSIVGRQSTDCRPTHRPTVGRLSTDCRPTVDRLSTDCRPIVDRLSTDCRPTSLGRILVTLALFSETLEQVSTQIPWSLVFGPALPWKRGPVSFLRWYWRISGESPLADSQSTVDRPSTDSRLTACRPTVGRQSADRLTDCRPTVYRQSLNCRSTVGR